jgi:26S proteasome regulatory subunit N8
MSAAAAMETDEPTTNDKATVVIKAPPAVDDVIIHPLVLLSVADHYHRVARGTRKRVVGVLLGSCVRGKVDATNSFAVPFEEDARNPVRLSSLS